MNTPFRTLFRLSLSRLVDVEILTSGTSMQGLYARGGGVLIALSIALALLIVQPYLAGVVPRAGIDIQLRNDEEFLLSLTIAAGGLFSVLVWNSILPDRRDCLVLGTLPLQRRAIAAARLLALTACLFGLVLVLNAFVACSLPFVQAHSYANVLRNFAAWWLTVLSAASFPLLTCLVLQGVAAQLLPWNTFLRVSGVLQLTLLCAVLVLLFVTPPFGATMVTNPPWSAFLPSFWFTGLLHVLKGDQTRFFPPLALVAIRNLAITASLGALVFALGWTRSFRKIIEAPDIVARRAAWLSPLWAFLMNHLLPHPIDRAVVLFTIRTALRSRQHRLILAAYGGVGFAFVVAFSKSLVDRRHPVPWWEPNPVLLTTAGLLLICSAKGARAVFSLPHSLGANWIFRTALVHAAPRYFDAVRKSLLIIGVFPVWTICAAAYLAVWPLRYALEASAVLLLIGSIVAEASLYQFRKIPFTCSWIPADGQSVSTVRWLAYVIYLLTVASLLGNVELWALRTPLRFAILIAILCAVGIYFFRRNAEVHGSAANSAANQVQFEGIAPAELLALDLRPDGVWSTEQA